MPRFRAAILLLIASGSVSCHSIPRADDDAVRTAPDPAVVRAIEQGVRDYDAAVNAGDLDALMALWGDDAVMIPPEGPVVRGKTACRRSIAAGFQAFRNEVRSTVRDIRASGDLAVAHLEYVGTATPRAGGEPVTKTGQWVNVYRREPASTGDRWLIVMEMWTAEGPPEAGGGDGAPDRP